ncbi:uncharacterized protein LOC103515263 [Diaphorina citri]|uniref:Uncharacterized protein LOC103515263 n=1 Tax=Diaphorina citri TaxID=121845 RepID=A0A1S3DBK6_DIACI|nr:uncharacterized protein LOC103515263 [Diaphorina citri]
MTSNPAQTPTLTVDCRMLRSPSHESITTDLSLFSVSSTQSLDTRGVRLVTFRAYPDSLASVRGPSPNPDSKSSRPPDIPEAQWFEEENEVIRSCAALSSALGIQKSFSTSDISQLDRTDHGLGRPAISELALSAVQRSGYLLEHLQSSPLKNRPFQHHHAQGHQVSNHTEFKQGGKYTHSQQVRQTYIRRRLLTTYMALERLSQSEFNLDRLEVQAKAASLSLSGTAASPSGGDANLLSVPGTCASSSLHNNNKYLKNITMKGIPKIGNLSEKDIDRERGVPLSKYDRNMMIFNWLHTLDIREELPLE